MTQRTNDASTTQRRTMHPHRRAAGGEVPACLVVLQGQRLGQRINLGDEPLIIGRAPEAEFQIIERSVSRAPKISSTVTSLPPMRDKLSCTRCFFSRSSSS